MVNGHLEALSMMIMIVYLQCYGKIRVGRLVGVRAWFCKHDSFKKKDIEHHFLFFYHCFAYQNTYIYIIYISLYIGVCWWSLCRGPWTNPYRSGRPMSIQQITRQLIKFQVQVVRNLLAPKMIMDSWTPSNYSINASVGQHY